jgi:hypothetical protein
MAIFRYIFPLYLVLVNTDFRASFDGFCLLQPHKDTPRGPNHFGTLLIFLPCQYTGGVFHIRHHQEHVKYDFGNSNEYVHIPSCGQFDFLFCFILPF